MSALATLPNRWTISTLGQQIVRSEERIDPSSTLDQEYFYVGLENIVSHTGQLVDTPTTIGSQILSAKNVFHEGEILYGRLRPNLNKVHVAEREGICSTDIWVFKPTDTIDRDYAAYYLRSRHVLQRVVQWASGANLPRIDTFTFESIPIPLPPLSEQRQIVVILRKADELRRLRREAQREAQALLPALFEEMFGNILTNSNQWQTVRIERICDLVRGSSPRPQGDSRFFGGPIPRLMVADITRDGMYVTPKIDSLTVEGASKSRPMNAGDVVMTVSGAPGLPAILAVDACIHDGFVGFHNLNEEFKPEYFYSVLSTMEVRNAAQAVGATFQNLTTDQINKWLIPKPPIELQAQYTARLDKIIKTQLKILNIQQDYEALFSALLARAFSGELTAAWRERRADALTLEAAARDQRLRERGAAQHATTILQAHHRARTIATAVLTVRGARDTFLNCLSEEQQLVWQATQANDDYLNAEVISQSHDLPLARARQTLELLASAGLLLPVSLWNSEIGDYATAYRRLRPANDDEEQRGDEAYTSDLAVLGAQ